MKTKTQTMADLWPARQGWIMFVAAALAAVPCQPAKAKDGNRGDRDEVRYRQVNLVSDQAGMAMLQDEHFVNAWGISESPTSPFWVSANGTGLAVLYVVTNTPAGDPTVTKLSLEVNIPGEGNPTGQVFNHDTNAFNADVFIFASEDGTISGWRGALGTNAEILAQRPTAVYKGITLASGAGGTVALAANFSEATVDVYDSMGNLTGQFADPRAPEGYAPFNVQNLDGMLVVTYAKQDADKEDDVPGPGHGLIDLFNLRTGRFHRLATGTDAGGRLAALNSPWGLAIAPGSGKHDGRLLVGNFGDGTILKFDDNGRFRGWLEGEDGKPIQIDGLWGLSVGNGGRGGIPGDLYFSAGPDDESHGLFGVLQPMMSGDGDGQGIATSGKR